MGPPIRRGPPSDGAPHPTAPSPATAAPPPAPRPLLYLCLPHDRVRFGHNGKTLLTGLMGSHFALPA